MVNPALIGLIISVVVSIILAGLLFTGALCETCKEPEPVPSIPGWCKTLEEARKDPFILNGDASNDVHPQKLSVKDSYIDRIYKYNLDPNSSIKLENVYVKDGVIGCNGVKPGWVNEILPPGYDYRKAVSDHDPNSPTERGTALGSMYLHSLDGLNLGVGTSLDLDKVCIHSGKVTCGAPVAQ